MAKRRLYKCQKCSMIYWGHELIASAGPFLPVLEVDCPTPGCGGCGLFGQAAPEEGTGCAATASFPIALALWHWVFHLNWLVATVGAAVTSGVVLLYMRRRYRPGSDTEDQQFAADQVTRHAELLHRRGDREAARYGFQRALTLLERDVEPRLEGAIVGRLANVERELGDFGAAREHYERALQIAEDLGDISGMINRHNNLGVLLGDDLRDPLGALEHVKQALALARRINDRDRIARMLIHTAKRFREAGRLGEADKDVEEALGVANSLHDNERIAEALHERACVRMTQHENALAEADLQEALRRFGSRSSRRLGQHLQRALETVQAAIRAGEHVTIGPPGEQAGCGELPFDLDPQASEALERGMNHMLAGRLKPAVDAIQEALHNAHVKNDPKASALARSNLGDMLRSLGRNAEAEQVLRQALEDADKVDVPFLEQSARLNLGLVLHIKGAWTECRDCLLRALALVGQEQVNRDAGRIHLALGNLYRDTADYNSAEDHYAQAERLAKERSDRELEGSVHQSRGNLHFKQRQWTLAKRCYEQAKRVAEQTRDARLQGIAMHMLGNVHRRLARFREAREMLQSSLSMAELCPTEVGRAGRLNDLAVVEQHLGLDAEAREHFQQSVDIYRQLGLASPEIAGCLQNLGVLLIRADEVPAGRDCILEASEMDNQMIAQAFGISSEEARLELLRQAQRRLDDLVSLVAHGGRCECDPKTVAACADVVIRRKGASLEALAIQRDVAASGRHPKLVGILGRLKEVRMALAQMTLAGKAVHGANYTPEAAKLVEEKRRLEQQAAKEIPDIAVSEQLRRSDRRAVALGLPEGCVLVEFLRFGFFPYPPLGQSPNLAPDRYAAFIIPAGQPEGVQMIDLGDAEPIDRMIVDFREAILDGPIQDRTRDLGALPARTSGTQESQAGLRLREALFDPLRRAFGDARRLLLAPDHNLTQLPLEVLPLGNGRCLIDQYHISYLSAARDALRLNQPASVGQTAKPLIVADPDFDLASPGSPKQAAAASTLRGPLESIRGSVHFGRLKGTRIEGQHVAGMLEGELWMSGQAVEGRLKACRSPRILHLATHGHFFANPAAQTEGRSGDLEAIGSQTAEPSNRLAEATLANPLLCSLLALAGANTWLRHEIPPSEAEDGLLTAEDAAGLDLVDTEMVVLSACDTGRGEVRTGEGVFGLRRAFVLAGARTLIMSLWKVPDEETQQLMEHFYRRLLQGSPRAEALREAQLVMKSKHPHPRFWGGFICQGDPGPLTAPRDLAPGAPEGEGNHDGNLT